MLLRWAACSLIGVQLQDSLFEPKTNFVDESRHVVAQGGGGSGQSDATVARMHTLGRVLGSENPGSDLQQLLEEAELGSRLQAECHLILLSDLLLLCEAIKLVVPNPRYRKRGRQPQTIEVEKFAVIVCDAASEWCARSVGRYPALRRRLLTLVCTRGIYFQLPGQGW